jgi:hypothetical protein
VTPSRQLLQHLLADASLTARITDARFRQGPLSPPLPPGTHASKLADDLGDPTTR